MARLVLVVLVFIAVAMVAYSHFSHERAMQKMAHDRAIQKEKWQTRTREIYMVMECEHILYVRIAESADDRKFILDDYAEPANDQCSNPPGCFRFCDRISKKGTFWYQVWDHSR